MTLFPVMAMVTGMGLGIGMLILLYRQLYK